MFHDRCVMKEKCKDKDVRYDEWLDVVMDGTSVKKQRHNEK